MIRFLYCPIAQLAERLVLVQKVTGSNPVGTAQYSAWAMSSIRWSNGYDAGTPAGDAGSIPVLVAWRHLRGLALSRLYGPTPAHVDTSH